MPSLLSEPRPQLIDANGDPIVNGYLEFWEAGTSTHKDTYDDYALTTPNPNPVRTASDGRPKDNVNIFLDGAYKVDARDANDVSLPGYPVDNVVSADDHDFTGLTATVADLNSTTTTALTKTSDYPIIEEDRGKTILADASSADIDITLLPVASAGDKYKIIIKKIDNTNNQVNIITNFIETVDVIEPYVLYDYNDFIEVHCDGSNWKVVASQIRGTIVALPSTLTLTLADNGKMFNIDAAGGDVVVTLPSALTVGKGYQVAFKRIDSSVSAVTIEPVGAETIDDESSLSMPLQFEYYSIKSDGFVWFIISEAQNVGGFTTGDVKPTFRTIAQDPGWAEMNDGTIGSATSGADNPGPETKDLFILLWDNVIDLWAPVITGRGASALEDWNANKKLRLPLALGRALCGDGAGAGLTPRAKGEVLGYETHVLTIAELAAHNHIEGQAQELSAYGRSVVKDTPPWRSNSNNTTDVFLNLTSTTGSDTAHNNMQPSLFTNVHIKL